ncbi:MAG: hypothetical protein P8J79_01215 [Halioglobus sp.]|nr:hypothetical protein [Halioglobus sp.]
MPREDDKLSTTALARKLDIPVQQLFAVLKDYGWIQRPSDSWVLTPKGEFEGGTYHSSQRYGSYIVWPDTLAMHPLLQAIECNQRITAASMCSYYKPLHARHINRSLAELGMQQHSSLGWELTRLGKSLGGVQEESGGSGAFYVTWPHEIVDNPVVHRELTLQSGQVPSRRLSSDAEPDLFADVNTAPPSFLGIDGHSLQSTLQTRVCNWLYLAQLVHAYRRALPLEELLYADFYVPIGGVYIDCWEEELNVGEMSGKFRKREIYRELNLHYLEINAADGDRLDEVLGRGLLGFGVRF